MKEEKNKLRFPIGIPLYFLANLAFVLVGLYYSWFRPIVFWVYILFTLGALFGSWKRMRSKDNTARLEKVGFVWLILLLGLLIFGIVRFEFSYQVNLLLLFLQPIEWGRMIYIYRKTFGGQSRRRARFQAGKR